MQLALPRKKNSTGPAFYSFGGAGDIILSPHTSWRTQAYMVWDHLSNDVLRDGRWAVRFSVGPAFNSAGPLPERNSRRGAQRVPQTSRPAVYPERKLR